MNKPTLFFGIVFTYAGWLSVGLSARGMVRVMGPGSRPLIPNGFRHSPSQPKAEGLVSGLGRL